MKRYIPENNHDIVHITDFEEVLISWIAAVECYATLYKKIQETIAKSINATTELEQIKDETINNLECLLNGANKPYLDINDLKNHTQILQKQNKKIEALLNYLA